MGRRGWGLRREVLGVRGEALVTRWRCTLFVFSLFGLTQAADAQDYPAKPVCRVVPFTAGGGTDVVGRAIAQKLTEAWGQNFVVENRGGAGGVIGAELAKYARIVKAAGIKIESA
jgi:tripartite-type tricarboxylate transporter receptor subunit TctC